MFEMTLGTLLLIILFSMLIGAVGIIILIANATHR